MSKTEQERYKIKKGELRQLKNQLKLQKGKAKRLQAEFDKELRRVQKEITSLTRKIVDLEDDILAQELCILNKRGGF